MKYILLAFMVFATLACHSKKDIQMEKNLDWPNLKRYAAENEALAPKAIDEFRVVFMGNSITEGWSQLDPLFFENKAYINRGIGGQTTPQMLIRMRQDVIDLDADAVVILAGINDIAGNTGPSTLPMIFNNIKSMTDIALANEVEVILCSVVPANRFPWQLSVKPAASVIALNEMIQSLAKEKGLSYVDYFSAMVDDKQGLKKELGYDAVHPNQDGYKIMGPLVEVEIAKLKTKS